DQEGFTSFAEVQTMTAQHLRAYLDTASSLFDELEGDAERYVRVVGCEAFESTCLEEFVTRFGRLVYRRDLVQEEVDELVAAALANATDAADQIRYATEVLLVSP